MAQGAAEDGAAGAAVREFGRAAAPQTLSTKREVSIPAAARAVLACRTNWLVVRVLGKVQVDREGSPEPSAVVWQAVHQQASIVEGQRLITNAGGPSGHRRRHSTVIWEGAGEAVRKD